MYLFEFNKKRQKLSKEEIFLVICVCHSFIDQHRFRLASFTFLPCCLLSGLIRLQLIVFASLNCPFSQSLNSGKSLSWASYPLECSAYLWTFSTPSRSTSLHCRSSPSLFLELIWYWKKTKSPRTVHMWIHLSQCLFGGFSAVCWQWGRRRWRTAGIRWWNLYFREPFDCHWIQVYTNYTACHSWTWL